MGNLKDKMQESEPKVYTILKKGNKKITREEAEKQLFSNKSKKKK